MTQAHETDFWTRRKASVRAETERESAEAVPDMPPDERPDDEVLAELGLKDPDSMEAGDDFSAFMKAAVPDRIRRRALRKLWLTNPVLANLDQLVDYGEDFTDAATVVENLQTSYQVGKGMLRHVLAADEEEAKETAAAGGDADTDAGSAESADADVEESPLGRSEVEDGTVAIAESASGSPEADPAQPPVEVAAEQVGAMPVRRMRFRFTA